MTSAYVARLQEIDIGCDRSGGVDVGGEIARALRLNYAFVPEFQELRSPKRSSKTQASSQTRISRCDVVQYNEATPRSVALSLVWGFLLCQNCFFLSRVSKRDLRNGEQRRSRLCGAE